MRTPTSTYYSTTDAQLARLPKYASEEIAWLRMRLDEKEKQYLAAIDSPVTKVCVDPYSDEPRYMPDRSCVSFGLPNGCVEVSIRYGELIVSGYDSHISVHPQACNIVNISVEPR